MSYCYYKKDIYEFAMDHYSFYTSTFGVKNGQIAKSMNKVKCTNPDG